jgi:hypothetical protein
MHDDQNNTHTTNGVKYRIPSHPDIIAALGRVVWNFLYIEEAVVAILFLSNEKTLEAARSLMAGQKTTALRALHTNLSINNAPQDLLDALKDATYRFEIITREIRNPVFHSGLFTAGYSDEGVLLPGMQLVDKDNKRTNLSAPDQIHTLALDIEKTMDSLSLVRSKL